MSKFHNHKLATHEEILMWKYFLKNYTLESILRDFETFKLSCHSYYNNSIRIEKLVQSLLSIKFQGSTFSPNFAYTIESEKHPKNIPFYFFRIRKLSNDNYSQLRILNTTYSNIDLLEMKTINDVWERPVESINTYQRLNCPKKTVLYTSLDPTTAMNETRLKPNDLFALIVYKHNTLFRYSDCSRFINFEELTEEENMKRYIMFDFLRNEFSRIYPTSYNESIQYATAYYISQKFFIGRGSQAIQYSSTRGLNHINFAFWDSIKEILSFVGFRFCRVVERDGSEFKIEVFADAFWDDSTNNFTYHSPFSTESKLIFGDPYLDIMLQK